MRVIVEEYEFITRADGEIDVRRDGEPWWRVDEGTHNAILALMREVEWLRGEHDDMCPTATHMLYSSTGQTLCDKDGEPCCAVPDGLLDQIVRWGVERGFGQDWGEPGIIPPLKLPQDEGEGE